MAFDCAFQREDSSFRYRAAAIIIEEGCVLFAGNCRDDYLYSIGGGVHMGETADEAQGFKRASQQQFYMRR